VSDGPTGRLPCFVGFRETVLDRVAHGRRVFVRELIDVAALQRAVGGGDGRVNAPGRLEPGETFTFAGPMERDQRLETVAIGEVLRRITPRSVRKREGRCNCRLHRQREIDWHDEE
jgi:hypothetical protein